MDRPSHRVHAKKIYQLDSPNFVRFVIKYLLDIKRFVKNEYLLNADSIWKSITAFDFQLDKTVTQRYQPDYHHNIALLDRIVKQRK